MDKQINWYINYNYFKSMQKYYQQNFWLLSVSLQGDIALIVPEEIFEITLPDRCLCMRAMPDGLRTHGNQQCPALSDALDFLLQDAQFGRVDQVVAEIDG